MALMTGCGNDKKENETKDNQTTEIADENTAENNENTENNQSVEVVDRGYKAADYVTLGEYKGIELSVEKAEVTEADVKEYVESMLAYYPAYENLDKTVVENGDVVNIDYEGLLDDVAFDGGTAAGQYLEIGSGSFIDGFEEGLIGAKVGDKLALNLTFPDPYQNNPDLAGKAVVFNVTVNAIVQKVEMTYETLTDEYVLSNFEMENVQALKDNVTETLNSTNEYYAQSNARSAMLDKILEICKVNELPEGVLDERVKQYKDQFAAMCKDQYGLELAEYLEQSGISEEEFDTQTVEYMQENVEMELMLLAIAEKEGIELDAEGYQTYVANMMSNYGFADEATLYDTYGEAFVQDSYICNKVLDKLMEEAVITYTQPVEEAEATETNSEKVEEEAVAGTDENDATTYEEGEELEAENVVEEENAE